MLIISFLATVHASLLRSVRQRAVLDCLAFQSLAELRFEKCNIDSEDITLVDCASHGKNLNCIKKKEQNFRRKIVLVSMEETADPPIADCLPSCHRAARASDEIGTATY